MTDWNARISREKGVSPTQADGKAHILIALAIYSTMLHLLLSPFLLVFPLRPTFPAHSLESSMFRILLQMLE